MARLRLVEAILAERDDDRAVADRRYFVFCKGEECSPTTLRSSSFVSSGVLTLSDVAAVAAAVVLRAAAQSQDQRPS